MQPGWWMWPGMMPILHCRGELRARRMMGMMMRIISMRKQMARIMKRMVTMRLTAPGAMMPGQLGPMRRDLDCLGGDSQVHGFYLKCTFLISHFPTKFNHTGSSAPT